MYHQRDYIHKQLLLKYFYELRFYYRIMRCSHKGCLGCELGNNIMANDGNVFPFNITWNERESAMQFFGFSSKKLFP